MGFLEPIKMIPVPCALNLSECAIYVVFWERIRIQYLVFLEPLRSHLLGLHSRTLELAGLEGMNLQRHRIPLDRIEHYCQT
jgi:hypothetical protein